MLIKKEKNNKRGQIWVETVIYTLIGLSLIGLVLAIVTPKINESRDRAVIEQTIASLNSFDSKINEILSAPGNVRVIEFKMKRGELFFDTQNDMIIFKLTDSRSLFSEPGIEISVGKVNVTTTEGEKEHEIVLSLSYNEDITFDGEEGESVKFSGVSIPYKFSIENKGFQEEVGSVQIDIREGS